MLKYTLIFCVLTTANFCMEESDIQWISEIEIGRVCAGEGELIGYAKKVKGGTVCYVKDSQSHAYKTYVSSGGSFIVISESQNLSKDSYNKFQMLHNKQLALLSSKNAQDLKQDNKKSRSSSIRAKL